jgi:uncharacterized RDD family membrane protein YckC
MTWYYAVEGRSIGPIEDAAFQNLVKSGAITLDTMVWNETMTEWQPYRQVAPASQRIGLKPAGQVLAASGVATCSQCGNAFAQEEMIQYEGSWVCATCKPLFFQRVKEGGEAAVAMEYAGFWIRGAAFIIDALIIGVASIVLLLPFYPFLFGEGEELTAVIIQAVWQILILGLQAGYVIFFLGRYGATPGKMAVGVKVVTAEGGPISYARATGRFFAEILSGCTCYIGYLIAAFDVQKRALHDHICNTRVIRR